MRNSSRVKQPPLDRQYPQGTAYGDLDRDLQLETARRYVVRSI